MNFLPALSTFGLCRSKPVINRNHGVVNKTGSNNSKKAYDRTAGLWKQVLLLVKKKKSLASEDSLFPGSPSPFSQAFTVIEELC
jgi:hypothetical protein